MRRSAGHLALLAALVVGAGCGSEGGARPAGDAPVAGGEALASRLALDPDLYRSVLVVDVETLRRLDPRAPRDALLQDVIGADPLLGALLPRGFRSLGDIRRIEYRARGFAAEAWSLLVRFEGSLEEALDARGLTGPAPAAPAALPGARPTLGVASGEDELLVAPRESLEEERRAAPLAAPVTLGPDEVAAWYFTHVDEEFAGQESALPRELWLRARRHSAPAVIRLEVRGVYADAPAAAAGFRHWEGLRRSLAANAWVGLTGLDRPLSEGRVVKQGLAIGFTTTLRSPELRVLLAAVAAMHGRPEAE